MGDVTEQTATLRTNEGDIVVNLFPDHAPTTVENFTGLAEGKKEYRKPNASGGDSGPFYDGSVFHRVISGFMIQGGDPTGTGMGGPGYQFGDEFHPELKFDRPYLLAMANAGPGTNGSQFFITVGPTPHLNRRHTIFGEVADAESRAVVDKIASTADRPQRPAAVARGDRADRDQLTGPPPPAGVAACVRHPDRATRLACSRCERPACPDCLREASVGYQCVDCVAAAAPTRAPRRAAGTRPVVVPTLVALNLAVFAWTAVQARSLLDNADAALFREWALVPYAVAEGEWWRLLTAGFLHIGPLHIAFNMFALWVLGRDLEIVLGRGPFLALYLVSLLGGSTAVVLFADPRAVRGGRVRRRVRADERPVAGVAAVAATLRAGRRDHRAQPGDHAGGAGYFDGGARRRARRRRAGRGRAGVRPAAAPHPRADRRAGSSSPPCCSR